MKRPPAVCMISLGCAKNLVDTELFLGSALGGQFAIAPEPLDADVIVINTCGFIESARQECRQEIQQCVNIRQQSPRHPKIVVMGCWAQRDPETIQKEFAVDAVWGLAPPQELARRLAGLAQTAPLPQPQECGPQPRLLTTPPSYSYLRIADGCSNRCHYCAIPLIRGDMHSRGEQDILAEARILEENGVSEILVIAQDTTAWGMDVGRKDALPDLLEKLLCAVRVPRLRLLYAHPAHISMRVLDLLRKEPRLCGYIDLPLQHTSDRMLAAMGRGYGRARVDELLAALAGGDTVLRTTLLTGFPGETDEDFASMLHLVEQGVFTHLGVFAWSPEEGTPACALPDRVPPRTAQQRCQALMEAQAAVAFARLDKRKGTVTDILLDEPAGRKNLWLGRTTQEAPDVDGAITVRAPGAQAGTIIRARITARDGYDLKAEAVHER